MSVVFGVRPTAAGRPARPTAMRAVRAVAVTAALCVPAGCGSSADRPDYLGVVRAPPFELRSLTLPAVSVGRPAQSAPLRAAPGEVRLLYFGYTHCPDVCPTTLSEIGAALHALTPSQRARVQTAMVTVDPARDRANDLVTYMGHFVRRHVAFRTTDAARLRRVERVLGAGHRKGPVARDGSYEMAHTSWVYAVDDHGASRVQWPFGTDAEAMTHDLRLLLDSQRPSLDGATN